MLASPKSSVGRSVEKHNVDLAAFCDWIEATALFVDLEISTTDVIDLLIENYLYDEQDFASEIVESALFEIRRRHHGLGAHAPLVFEGLRISVASDWRDNAAYAFCVFLSIVGQFPGLAEKLGRDYNTQGELFEHLTQESVAVQFKDWVSHLTGWSRTNTALLQEVVERVAEKVGEPVGRVERWTADTAKEAGLDLVLYRAFADDRVGGPVYLFQCASGADWERKINTPELKIWKRIVEFTAEPKKAFSTPFAFLDADFIRITNRVDGMLLDRPRLLLAACHDPNWLSVELRDRIVAWLEPRVGQLPLADE